MNGDPAENQGAKSEPVSRIEEIQGWLVTQVAKSAKMPEEKIDLEKKFDYYGLSSAESIGLVGDLEAWLDRPLDASIIWDYPTIESLSRHLSDK